MRTAAFSLALGLALGATSPALASDTFRCGEHIVETGMSLAKVQEYCGPPTEQTGDRWTYDRGPDELIIILHIEPDNTVGDIEAKSRE